MPTRFLVLLVLIFSCLLAGCGSPPATAGTDPRLTAVAGLFPVLKLGMSTEVIRQKLGAPAAINPMASPTGKAEVWVYYFEKNVGMAQVATSTIDVPTFGLGASGPGMTTAPEEVYSLAEKQALVTLSLLIYNDRLAAQKAGVVTHLKYQ
jgi:hypothetical protein